MDATQIISDSFPESDEEENEIEKKGDRPLAKLCILKNEHIPETELPLFLGENVLGRDPSNCTVVLAAPSVSKQHATICISVYHRRGRHGEVDIEALVWDLGSLNGTSKGHLNLTPNVRYALSECDGLVLADIPCQYVSCSADTVSSQEDFKTPVSRSLAVKARMPGASDENEIGNGTGSKKSVNTATEARVSSDLGDARKTPVRTNCLSFEQTPTQPESTLVPESDLDSDEEKGGPADRKHSAVVSDSDSNKSFPTCSTFLSPTNKIVPESEDESPIIPLISTKNRPHRRVDFNREETDINVGRQQLEEKNAPGTVDGSQGREVEGAAVGGRASEESRHHVPVNQESKVVFREDELPTSTSAVFTAAIPAFQMDSDTDVEGEEEGTTSAVPVTLNTNQQADRTENTAQFHLNSDTDVDEDDDDALVPESVRSHENTTKPSHSNTMDSDTDVDDNEDDMLDASKAKPVSFQTTHSADAAPSTDLKHFHLDSDTDVDEEEEKESVPSNRCSKIDQTPTRLAESAPAAPHSPPVVSETNDEDIRTPASSEPSVACAVTESRSTADVHADLDILSDSGTDVEDDSPLRKPFVETNPSSTHGTAIPSDTATDVNKPTVLPAGESDNTVGLHVAGETGVEDEHQVPKLHRENTPGLLAQCLQNCSTPVHLLDAEEQVEHMETQAFLTPTSIRCAVAPALRTKALDSDSDNLEDEVFVVAETQSFVLQSRDCHGSPSKGHIMEPTQQFGLDTSDVDTSKSSDRGESFQLGLSDSSHLQDQVQQLAMESTQAFVSVEETQPYVAISHVDSQMSNVDAAHNSEEGMEPPVCSTVPEREGQVDLALEATQAYILDPYQESEDGTDDDEKNTAAAETQLFIVPLSLTIAMAETQPMCSSVNQVKPGSQNEAKEHRQAVEPQERSLNKDLTIAETQPMYECDDNDSDDEDSFPGSRKRKTKQLRIEDEQTQPLSSESSLPETQPMHNTINETNATSGNEDHSVPGPRQRKTKALHLEEKKKQLLISSELSVAETQPMIAGDDGESNDLDSPLGTRKGKAKPLQIQEEETQTNSESSVFETKPEQAGTSGITATTKRRTRASLRGGPEKCIEPPKKQKRGKNKTCPSTRRRRGKSKPSDDTSEEEEEEVEQTEQSREIKPIGQQNNNDEEENKRAHNVNLLKEEEQRSGEKEDVTELRPERRENTEKKRIQIDEEGNQLEREIKEKEEQESMQAERLRPARQRAKAETIQRVRKEQEEKERAERTQKDREEQLEGEEKERLEHEKAEREEKERLEIENARMENERKEQEEKERLETQRREVAERLERERKDLEHCARLELEATEPEGKESPEKEKQEIEAEEKTTKEQQENKEENKAKVPTRGRRSTRRTAASMCTTGPEQDTAISASEEGPAMRTRSHSNSSNSVSSERSASAVHTQDSKGRGRGRGARRTSEPTHTVISRKSNRRVTVAAESKQHGHNDVSQGRLSRSNSSSSLSSEISSCSLSSRGRGRGSRSHVRGRKEEPVYIPAVISQSDPKHRLRGMKSTKAEQSSHDVAEKTDSQQPTTTRGRWRSSGAEPAGDENHSNQEGPLANEESLLPKKSVRGRGQKGVKSETVGASGSLTVNNRDEVKERITGRKRQLEANTEDESSSSSKIYKGKEQEQTTEVAGEASIGQTKDDILDQAVRRASVTQSEQSAQLSANEVEVQENNERRAEKGNGKRGKGRVSAFHKKKKEEQEEIGASEDQHARVVESEPQTPVGSVSRKRRALADSSPVAKSPRPSSNSPEPSVLSRAPSQAFKVLFTGLVDEAGERVLARLGGSMAKGVADMNCLVTDKVRRTVKFLCALAKGVPIVTTQWLEKSGKAGSFLPPRSFFVKDLEQEKKFSFCLKDSLSIASNQPLLQGYEIHVTKSVKPEPVQMKDILTCSGATFLPKMPSSHKSQTVVISCEEDWPACAPALSASVPIVTAEFILTGILQQKLDFQTHVLSAPTSCLQPAGGRGRGKKKR